MPSQPAPLALGIAAVVVLTAALAGCESLSAPTPQPSASAQAGALLTGDSFSTSVPPDWSNRIKDPASVNPLRSGGVPILVLERGPYSTAPAGSDEVVPTIGVVRLRDHIPDDKILGYLKNVPGATLQRPPQHYALGRDEGVLVIYTRSASPGLATLDMIVNHHGTDHEVFLSAPTRDFAAAIADVTQITDTWTWKDGP